MGLKGYARLLTERTRMLQTFPARLEEVAKKHGERILLCPTNTISFGMTLDGLARPRKDDESDEDYTQSIDKEISSFGAMLFCRCVSGTRVVQRAQEKTMGGHKFEGFGSSVSNFPHAYMTAACAIGVSQAEVSEFFVRLDKTLTEFHSKKKSTGKD
jgi:O-phospho-L-seryl-tRNASec:L-selenocysteinyl-tRNA synthase